MRATNGIPLGWPLPLTGWHCQFRPTTKGQFNRAPGVRHCLQEAEVRCVRVCVCYVISVVEEFMVSAALYIAYKPNP
jgi:hypothetical protein